MDIQEFVRESLIQIVEGIAGAKASKSEVNPGLAIAEGAKVPSSVLVTVNRGRPVFLVDFDLAVTSTGKTEASGKAGIAIVQVFNAGGEKSASNETISATRIKFVVPIAYT